MKSSDLWIMVDIETSGPVYGKHSLTELGAVVGSIDKGVIAKLELLITPIGREVIRSKQSYERARLEGLAPATAMEKFREWSKDYLANHAKFIARPAAFDWPWIVYYAWTYLGENPFGFKAVCASSWFESRGLRFQVELPHRAVDDAEIQLKHFFAVGARTGDPSMS